MKDLNTVCIIGRQTRDLTERDYGYTAGGNARLNLSLAVNNTRKEGDQFVDAVSFINVTVWGRSAESLNQYICKGKQIAVQGHLQQNSWETQDGQKRSQLEVVSDYVELLGSKNDGHQQSGNYAQNMQQNFSQPNSYAQQQQQFAQQQQTPQQVQAISNAFDGQIRQDEGLY